MSCDIVEAIHVMPLLLWPERSCKRTYCLLTSLKCRCWRNITLCNPLGWCQQSDFFVFFYHYRNRQTKPAVLFISCHWILGATIIHIHSIFFRIICNIHQLVHSMAKKSSSIMSVVTLWHWKPLLFSISQVKPFIAPYNNVDISGLWLNAHVSLLFCSVAHVHMKNDFA